MKNRTMTILSPIGRISAFLLAVFLSTSCARLITIEDQVLNYSNPLDVSIADPQILRDDDGTYYLYGTTPHNSSEGFEVYSSRDLVHWRRHGWCYRKSSTTWGKDNFWAPEVIKKGDTYYLFYTAFNPSAHVRSICLATSSSPLGPFKDVVTPIMPPQRGFIDASPFYDPASNRHYLYVMEENLRPPKIKVARLSEDLRSLDTKLTDCITATQPWENKWVEGPFVVKHEDSYYLMYSGSGYASPNYAVGYAIAPSPTGPWTKFERNPILHKNGSVSGPGHHSVIESPDGKDLFIAYHTHLTFEGGWQRQLAIDRMGFVPTGKDPFRLTVLDAPTTLPQLLPSGESPMRLAKSDDFDGPLDLSRWHTFGEYPDKWKVADGSLQIATVDGDLFTNRTDGTNIFLQYAPRTSHFKIQTEIAFSPKANYEQAFLLIFQDQSNYIRVSNIFADGRKIEWAKEVMGKFESSSVANPLAEGQPVHLQIARKDDEFEISCSADRKSWKKLGSYLAPLTEQLQVGIGAYAPGSKKERLAKFDYFKVVD